MRNAECGMRNECEGVAGARAVEGEAAMLREAARCITPLQSATGSHSEIHIPHSLTPLSP
jgi:hypothetical protein